MWSRSISTQHLKALYKEGEIVESATCKGYLQVRTEGARKVRGACSRRKSSTNGYVLKISVLGEVPSDIG